MDKEVIDLLIEKQPKLEESRPTLELIEEGTVCIHRAWGIGVVQGYNADDNKFIIDFAEKGQLGHRMDPLFCMSKLEILPSESLITRKVNEPKAVDEMVKKEPTQVIVAILKHCSQQSALSNEIERQLSYIIGTTTYKKWWNTTKKLLIKDPDIAVPEKKTEPYILRSEPIKPEDEVLDLFYSSKSAKKRIDLASKLLELSVKHEDIKEQLPDILKTLTEEIKNSTQLNSGEKLRGVWVRNDLARFIHEDPEKLDPTSSSIIETEISRLPELAETVLATSYHRFLDLILRSYPESWQKLVLDLLRTSSGKLTHECITFLIEQKCEAKLKETLIRWLNEQALKEALLQWILKNRSSRKFSPLLHNLISPKLFSAILYAIDYAALQISTNRRIPLAEMLSEDPDIIAELLAEATPETARDLATTLMLNQGFEDLSKKSLLARFIRLFPNIQSLVGGHDTVKEDVSSTLIVSTESFQTRQKEYEILIKERIPENKKAIAIAREHGDLRENAEYKMARQEQETLLALKGQLEQDLSQAQTTDFSNAPSDKIGIGCNVALQASKNGKTIQYSILGAWDSNPEKNILSYQTPLAQSLLSKKVGDTVTANIDQDKEEWVIRNISRYVESN